MFRLKSYRFFLISLILFLLVIFGQNCTYTKFEIASIIEPESASKVADGNGQGYDGKLTFIQLERDFSCENVSAPRAILRRDENSTWVLIENEKEKCSAKTEMVTDVTYETGQTHLVYRERDFYLDQAADWSNLSLKGHITNYLASATVNPNSIDANPGDGICAKQSPCSRGSLVT